MMENLAEIFSGSKSSATKARGPGHDAQSEKKLETEPGQNSEPLKS
jgi:hypothetical protein